MVKHHVAEKGITCDQAFFLGGGRGGGNGEKRGRTDRPDRRLEMGKQNIQIKKGLLALALTEFTGTFQNVANRLHEKHCFEVSPARRVTSCRANFLFFM